MKDITVISLFDGIGTGFQALKELEIKVKEYHAFEKDKFAAAIAKYNHPEIIQHGDVTLEAFETNMPTSGNVDLLFAGFPCQDFSQAGKGAGLSGDRGKLFFNMVDIINLYKPKMFLLENVARMDKKTLEIINKILGVKPVRINSSKFSAQNRKRFYWLWNIEHKEQLENLNILLKDILGSNESSILKTDKKFNIKKSQDKSSCLSGGAHSGGNHSDMDVILSCKQLYKASTITGHDYNKRIYSEHGKSPTLTKFSGGNLHTKINGVKDEKFNWKKSFKIDWNFLLYNQKQSISYFFKIFSMLFLDILHHRRLTVIECERLQTMPDNYTKYGDFDGHVKKISNTQRYKALGNGWTLNVIIHLLQSLSNQKSQEVVKFPSNNQLELFKTA